MNRLLKFLSARIGDQCRLLLAGFLLLLLPVVFSIGSFVQVRQRMMWISKWAARIVPGTPTYIRVVSAVKLADHHLPGSRKCLIRSSTAEVLLLLYEFTPEHRIGVAKEEDGEISAHSWLELDGDVIIGELDDLARFDPLPSLEVTEAI